MLYQHLTPPFWRRHPWFTGAAALIVCWQLVHGAYVVVGAAALLAAIIFVRRMQRAKQRRDAGLRARAEYEHRLSLVGDPHGLYGRYPPVQPGWFPDPQIRYQWRYFDGAVWTPYAVRR